MLTIQDLLKINSKDLTDFNIKLNNIEQFNVDTRTLYSIDQEELIKEISYKCSVGHRQNFNYDMDRKYTIHFIRYKKNTNFWLYIGIFEQVGEYTSDNITRYKLKKVNENDELEGRLVFTLNRKNGSQNVRFKLEKSLEQFTLHSILDRKLDNLEFTSYNNVNLTFLQLEGIIKSENPSWSSALSHLNAIYLQIDTKTGKFYVGSAYGEEKLWKRWKDYVYTFHGGNKLLKELIEEDSAYIRQNFKYSILEVLPPNIEKNAVIDRENYWKELLLTRKFGYNDN